MFIFMFLFCSQTTSFIEFIKFSLIGERISQQAIAQLIGEPRYLRFNVLSHTPLGAAAASAASLTFIQLPYNCSLHNNYKKYHIHIQNHNHYYKTKWVGWVGYCQATVSNNKNMLI